MSQSLVNDAFGGSHTTLWNLTGELGSVNSAALNSITSAAIAVGGILYVFQISSIVWQSFKQGGGIGGNILNRMLYLLMQLAVICAIIKTPAYRELYGIIVGLPAEVIAEKVTLIYWENFTDVWSQLLNPPRETAGFWGFLRNPGKVVDSLLTTLVATGIMVAVTILVFLIPLVQGKLFLYMFYIGPFALMFTICDYTQKVFHNWLSLSLAVAWTGVFGSVALLICTNGGIFDKIHAGDAGFNWVSTAVYGVIAIILLCSSFSISLYMFGAMGSGLQSMMSPGRQTGAVAGGIAGGIVGGAAVTGVGGAAMSKIGGGGSSSSSSSHGINSGSGGGSGGGTGGNGALGSSEGGNPDAGGDSSGGASSASVPRSVLQAVGNGINKASHAVLKAGGSHGHTAEKIVDQIESAINYHNIPQQATTKGIADGTEEKGGEKI